MNAGSGAGYNSKSPYQGAGIGKPAAPTDGQGSLNTNVFNIPKYSGLGGGIRGGLGGGIGGGLGRSSGIGGIGGGIGSSGSGNKQQEDNEFGGGRYRI